MQFAQRLLSTRGGTIAASGLAALLAAVIFVVYLHRYRASLNEAAEPMTVLVAKNLIERGTPGNAIATGELYQVTSVPRRALKDGAVSDPAALRGRIAVDDVYPGDQLTTADFTKTPTTAIAAKLTGDQRAIAVPVDDSHGLIGQVQTGDHVDVYAGFNWDLGDKTVPVMKLAIPDALVLDAPAEAAKGFGAGAQTTSQVSLRATPEQAAIVAWAVDNGKVWVTLRPKVGATTTKPSLVVATTLLLGTKPVATDVRLKRLFRVALKSAPPAIRAFYGGRP